MVSAEIEIQFWFVVLGQTADKLCYCCWLGKNYKSILLHHIFIGAIKDFVRFLESSCFFCFSSFELFVRYFSALQIQTILDMSGCIRHIVKLDEKVHYIKMNILK